MIARQMATDARSHEQYFCCSSTIVRVAKDVVISHRKSSMIKQVDDVQDICITLNHILCYLYI